MMTILPNVQGYTKHYPCSGEELASALASSLCEPRQAQPVAERAAYTSPSTLKSSSTMRSTSDTAGSSPSSLPTPHPTLKTPCGDIEMSFIGRLLWQKCVCYGKNGGYSLWDIRLLGSSQFSNGCDSHGRCCVLIAAELLTGNTIRSTSVKGYVPHEAIEMLKDLPMAQNLLAVLVQYQRAAKTELMSAAGMQHNAEVTQQLQDTLRVLLAPGVSQNDTRGSE